MATNEIYEIPWEDGTTKRFKQIESLSFEDSVYAILISLDEDENVIISKVVNQDGEEYLLSIDNEDEMARVSEFVVNHFKRLNEDPEYLFEYLSTEQFKGREYNFDKLGDDMATLSKSIGGWWKPLFLLDLRAQKAYVFMDEDEILTQVTDDDIDWDSLAGISDEVVERAKKKDAGFPTNIRGFENGIAEVKWEINPDGRYWADEDGFGMTRDVEIALFSYIDRTGKPLVKFRYINGDYDLLDEMLKEAKKNNRKLCSRKLSQNKLNYETNDCYFLARQGVRTIRTED